MLFMFVKERFFRVLTFKHVEIFKYIPRKNTHKLRLKETEFDCSLQI